MYYCLVSCVMSNSFATPWPVDCQAPLFIGFSRQEHWSGLPRPLQGIFPTEGLNMCLYISSIGRQVLYHGCHLGSLQFSSVQSQSCSSLCDAMNCSMLGFPAHHQLPVLAQTHGHWVSDAIQPSHPLLSPSPPAFNISQHHGLFQWVGLLHQVT